MSCQIVDPYCKSCDSGSTCSSCVDGLFANTTGDGKCKMCTQYISNCRQCAVSEDGYDTIVCLQCKEKYGCVSYDGYDWILCDGYYESYCVACQVTHCTKCDITVNNLNYYDSEVCTECEEGYEAVNGLKCQIQTGTLSCPELIDGCDKCNMKMYNKLCFKCKRSYYTEYTG